MRVFSYLFMFMLMLMAGNAFAQEISNEEFFQLFLASIGGLKGAGALGVALVVVKLVLAAFNTPLFGKRLDKLTGKGKLSLVSFLSYLSGVVGLVVAGNSWPSALFHASVMPLLTVFLNQVFKQFVEKADEPPKLS